MPRNPVIAEAERSISQFTESVTSALKAGKEVSLVGFGLFHVTKREARDGRNPQTGATLKIAASNTPGFRAGKGLKDACN